MSYGFCTREALLPNGRRAALRAATPPSREESFFGTLQRELLDRKSWTTRKELASAISEWIEAWYNPRRRHTSIDYLTPSTTNGCTPPRRVRHDDQKQAVRETGAGSRMPEPQIDILEARAEIGRSNAQRSREELGVHLQVLTRGCELLEDLAARSSVPLADDALPDAQRAIAILSFFVATRAGSVCHLLLEGFPTDAAALLRSLLEALALQNFLQTEPGRATEWLRAKRIPEAEILRAVEKQTLLAPTWGELGKAVHPNLVVIEHQGAFDDSGKFVVGMHGVHRPEQLFRLTANFGVFVEREMDVVQRNVDIGWSESDLVVAQQLSSLVKWLNTEIESRWGLNHLG